jgi:hypothetical protein
MSGTSLRKDGQHSDKKELLREETDNEQAA